MTVYGIELLSDQLRERCSTDDVAYAIVALLGQLSINDAGRLVAAIDDLIKARLDERQQALATAILEAAP